MPRPSDFGARLADAADNPAFPVLLRDWCRELAKDVITIVNGVHVSKDQIRVLTRFADMGVPSSKFEALGHTAGSGIDEAIAALTKAELLVALPYSETRDEHGGTRFKLTPTGWAALNRKGPTPVKTHGARVVTSRNGKHRRAS